MKILFVNSDRIGQGDDELGAKLMGSYLYSLARNEVKPDKIMFMNGGVRLTCEGSAALGDLRLLAADGVAIASCGTCLDWLGLTESLAVGVVGKMPDSVAAMMSADDVVSIG